MLDFSGSQISTVCGDLLDEMNYAGMTKVNFIKNIKNNVLYLILADDNIVKEGFVHLSKMAGNGI